MILNSCRRACRALAILISLVAIIAPSVRASDEDKGYGKVVQALPQSKIVLVDGLRTVKAPAVPISAKFEIEDKPGGGLSLSIYTAEKGVHVDAKRNVLKELAGDPKMKPWKPTAETLKGADAVAGTKQLLLLSKSKFSLIDVVRKAQKDQAGTVFAAIPSIKDGKPQCRVSIATRSGKVVEFAYDLGTGARTR